MDEEEKVEVSNIVSNIKKGMVELAKQKDVSNEDTDDLLLYFGLGNQIETANKLDDEFFIRSDEDASKRSVLNRQIDPHQ